MVQTWRPSVNDQRLIFRADVHERMVVKLLFSRIGGACRFSRYIVWHRKLFKKRAKFHNQLQLNDWRSVLFCVRWMWKCIGKVRHPNSFPNFHTTMFLLRNRSQSGSIPDRRDVYTMVIFTSSPCQGLEDRDVEHFQTVCFPHCDHQSTHGTIPPGRSGSHAAASAAAASAPAQ